MSYTTGIEKIKRHWRGNPISLNEALEKTYIARYRPHSSYILLPKCMVGKKIRILLEGKENKKLIESINNFIVLNPKNDFERGWNDALTNILLLLKNKKSKKHII